jgi:hypothetical protein
MLAVIWRRIFVFQFAIQKFKESRVLRRIFGPIRDEVTEEWRMLHNEELNDLMQYCLGDQIQKDEVGGACSMYGEEERCIRDLGGET